MAEGRIMKAISGFYYVKSDDTIFQCRGRGVFRKQKITPLVGDFVEFDADNPEEGYVLSIESRRNMLVRPPVANVDQAVIVSSAVMPDFNPLLLDRFLVLIESKDIKPVIFMTKKDLLAAQNLEKITEYQTLYKEIGYLTELVSSKGLEDPEHLKSYFTNHVSVIAGQSGVGKSSLLNAVNPTLELKTDDISESLGRGKHTTRHVELVEVGGGLVADTPGFSALDFSDIAADELGDYFPEIAERKADCKFRGCLHNKEPKCAVKQAVEDKQIASSRYDHYLRFLNEIHSRKPRY
ncbi:ribosome small subunit-dependent GTPase A [Lentibacillus salicampi]|uniref:Small ribosomal subunit biogenesis GTPase RsgA n=1 Tax=Lentibacillus salicampi TaxID=175306 RepID=A0A4Y9AFK8_9BACI|nr:ribosome small subunit-dependent GTPase A [Lentibacillus salicampi]TFJ94606.1 ribosome small subunit-dependent GTPase A [Lentibacillus salicampi]